MAFIYIQMTSHYCGITLISWTCTGYYYFNRHMQDMMPWCKLFIICMFSLIKKKKKFLAKTKIQINNGDVNVKRVIFMKKISVLKLRLCTQYLWLIVLYESIDKTLPNKLHGPMHYKIGYMCIQLTRVLYYVVITSQATPPISLWNKMCNEFTRVCQCLYTIDIGDILCYCLHWILTQSGTTHDNITYTNMPIVYTFGTLLFIQILITVNVCFCQYPI